MTGASRLIGDVFTNKIQITKIDAPTTSNGTSYGPGSSGQVLISNGISTYWGGLTPANIGAVNKNGDSMTGNLTANGVATLGTAANPWRQLIIGGATTATVTADSTNPKITFQENTGTQPVHIVYSDFDSYRSPAGLKIVGGASASPAWLEVEGQIYSTRFNGPVTGDVTGNATTATTATKDSSGAVIKDTYVKKAGDTMTSVLIVPEIQATRDMILSAGKLYSNITGSNVIQPINTTKLYANGIGLTNPATPNDVGFIRITGTGESDTVLEIATGDDGGSGEKIVVRQYNTSNVITHEAILLNTNGTTSFPISVTAPKFIGALQGNADTANKSIAANITTTTNAIAKYIDTAGTFANSGITIDNDNTFTISENYKVTKVTFDMGSSPIEEGWRRICKVSSLDKYHQWFLRISGVYASASPTGAILAISSLSTTICPVLLSCALGSNLKKIRFINDSGNTFWMDIYCSAFNDKADGTHIAWGAITFYFNGNVIVSDIQTSTAVNTATGGIEVPFRTIVDEPIFTLQDNDGTNKTTSIFTHENNQILKLPATIKASLNGNASTATALKDKTNNTLTYSNYGASGLTASAISWMTCWNGYELRAISKAETFNVVRDNGGDSRWVKKAGDTVSGTLHFKGLTSNDYTEGIRLHPSSNGWNVIAFCGTDNTGDSGTSANTWGLYTNSGNFYISKNTSTSGTAYLRNVNGVWSWNGTANGNAATATKATQDGSGNTITSTYVKKSGDTMTGNLTLNKITGSSANYGDTLPATGTEGQIFFKTGSVETKIDTFYPVGSIYMSVNSVNPGTLFGGTWEQIQDCFLLAAGSSYNAGSTGGKANYVAADMPAHTHTRGTMEITGQLSGPDGGSDAAYPWGFKPGTNGAFSVQSEYGSYNKYGGSYSASSGQTATFTASNSWTGATSQSGTNTTATIMPPYLAVYVWKRTA